MRRSVGFSPSIDEDMDDQEAESLIRQVRILRNGCFEPTLYLFRDEFERLATFWPCFYLVSTTGIPSSRGLVAWLKRLLRIEVKTEATVCACDNALMEFKARILERKAIPIDGMWTDIVVVREAEAHGDNG